MGREFLDVDPRDLRLPPSRQGGADPAKLWRQIARFGPSMTGMPPLEVYRDRSGLLVIVSGVTRATRIAKLLPGTLVRVEVIGTVNRDLGRMPTVGERLP